MINFVTERTIVWYNAGRYVAPELFRKEEYDTKVDVFSFALILQEVRSQPVFINYVCFVNG